MRIYIQPCESETETNGAAAALAAMPSVASTDVESTVTGGMELPLKNAHLRGITRTSSAIRAAASPPEKPPGMDWIMVAIWSFAVFSLGALLFCLYGIHAKCYGGWGF